MAAEIATHVGQEALEGEILKEDVGESDLAVASHTKDKFRCSVLRRLHRQSDI